MKVYRYLCEEEYNCMINGVTDKLGHNFPKRGLANTFRYNPQKRYIHFFKNKESMKRIQSMHLFDGKDYYFCEFDIPLFILIRGMGKGCYNASGYDIPYDWEREFIVNADLFEKNWLKSAEFDSFKHKINENLEKNKNNPDFELYL